MCRNCRKAASEFRVQRTRAQVRPCASPLQLAASGRSFAAMGRQQLVPGSTFRCVSETWACKVLKPTHLLNLFQPTTKNVQCGFGSFRFRLTKCCSIDIFVVLGFQDVFGKFFGLLSGTEPSLREILWTNDSLSARQGLNQPPNNFCPESLQWIFSTIATAAKFVSIRCVFGAASPTRRAPLGVSTVRDFNPIPNTLKFLVLKFPS